MPDINIQMKNKIGETWNKLFPKTKISLVEGLPAKLDDVDSKLTAAATKAETDAKIAIVNEQLADTGDQISELGTNKADIGFVISQISTIGDGSPKEVFATFADLVAAYPSGTTGIFVVNADGHRYSWSGTEWVSGGFYQAIALDNGAVRAENLDPGMIEGLIIGTARTGTPGYVNSEGFNGWGVIAELDSMIDIKRFYIKKETNFTATQEISISLWKSSSLSSITSATLIQSFTLTAAAWNALSVGQLKDFQLSVAHVIDPSAYYAVTVFTSGKVGVAQVGDIAGPKTLIFKNGLFSNSGTEGNYSLVSGAYGLFVEFQSTNAANKPLFSGDQVPEHDAPIKDLAADMAIVTQSGFVYNSEANGSTSSINGLGVGVAKGWGAIVKPTLLTIARVSIKKATVQQKPSYSSTQFAVGLWESSSSTSLYGAVQIASWTVPVADWLSLSVGIEKILTLPIEHTVDTSKFYALTIFANEALDVLLVGDQEPESITSIFQRGIFSNSTSMAWIGTSGGNYGAFFKLYSSLTSTKKVKIDPEQVPEHEAAIKSLQTEISSVNISKKYSIPHELHYENPLVKKCPVFLDHWLRRDKDMYVVLSGDSIVAALTASQMAIAGVAAVPPTADRRCFAGRVWELIQFGSPIYRRFDYGKNALIGSWDSTWASSDAPAFTESGTFETYYRSGAGGQSAYDHNLDSTDFTSKITNRDCPITKFYYDDGNRSIPKRISKTANASVTFTIPAGFKKFDFIYDTNQQADDTVTITVAEGSGKLRVNTVDRVFLGAIEANGYVFSQRELKDESENGYDSGIPSKRLFFEKANIADSITITITKSADTSKYLFYWGVSYWGTATEPNACHIINAARGSSRMESIYNNRIYHYTGVVPVPDLVIQECTLINNSANSDPAVFLTQFNELKTYVDTLETEYFYIIPHANVSRLVEPYIRYWDTAKAEIIKKEDSYLDIKKMIYKTWQMNYPNKEVSWSDYVNSLLADGIHPNNNGFDFYQTMLEPIFDLM
jgi:hypothetical protein